MRCRVKSNNNEIKINIGGLESIASVYRNASKGLSKFTKMWAEGKTPKVIWDCRSIRSGKMSMAAISFFLAIAHRVRQFTNTSQLCQLEWNPKILGFWADIGFFRIADNYGLFEWPYEIGGYESNKTNPNTKLIACDPLEEVPNINDLDRISEFKKIHREYYKQYIIENCEALFAYSDNDYLGESIPLVMSRTCAELATNSLLWGRSTPFIGLQRSTKYISICVSDIGIGFKHSLLSRYNYQKILNKNNSDIISVALGSVINKFGFGLKRAISTVIELNGHISITSNSGEIYWKHDLWNRFISNFKCDEPEYAIDLLPQSIYKANYEHKERGYVRSWSNSIRGSRISFTIPLVRKG